ncbi:MAG TPA: hypothetical protein VHV77_04080, partial [Pirellulales bacterium]|nr:hypothetical protein [Pirellulales bacterium]
GVANWNGSVETDGIVLRVMAYDKWGRTTPVDGTLDVELIGEGPGTTGMRRTFPVLGRWSRHVTPDTFTGDGNVYRLDYQALHPEFNLRLGNYALIHATFAIPGHGTFEASANVTILRPYSPMRDRWQQFEYQRFFPNERAGRGKQQTPYVYGGI